MPLEKTKILIIEDDILWSIFIESIFEGNDNFELLDTVVTLNHIEEVISKNRPDLLLCDISIGNSSILTLFKGNKYNDIPKIFMTSHLDSNTYDAANLISKSTFLAKPFHKFTLLSTIDILLKNFPISPITTNLDQYLEVRNNHFQLVKLSYENIVFIKAEGNYSIINVLDNKKYALKKSLTQLLMNLEKSVV